MESSEKILSVLFSIWGTEEGFLKRGKEGMLILTNKRVAFVSKTKMNSVAWRSSADQQLRDFRSSNASIRVPKLYPMQTLQLDLLNEDNMNIPMNQLLGLESETKRWGTRLKMKFKDNDGKSRAYKFVVVKMWATYPVKDPIGYEAPDWEPWIMVARSYM